MISEFLIKYIFKYKIVEFWRVLFDRLDVSRYMIMYTYVHDKKRIDKILDDNTSYNNNDNGNNKEYKISESF